MSVCLGSHTNFTTAFSSAFQRADHDARLEVFADEREEKQHGNNGNDYCRKADCHGRHALHHCFRQTFGHCGTLNCLQQEVLQRVQILGVGVNHRVEVTVPVSYGKPQRNRCENGLTKRHVNLPPYAEFARAVHLRRFVQLVGNAFEETGNDNHVVHGVQRRNDVHPEGVKQTDTLNDKEEGDKSAAEKHRDDVCPVEEVFTLKVVAAHCVGDNRRKHQCRQRAYYRAPYRDKVTVVQFGIFQHHFVVFKGKQPWEEVHAALCVVRALVERADDDVHNGVHAQQAEDCHPRKVDYVKHVNVHLLFVGVFQQFLALFALQHDVGDDYRNCKGRNAGKHYRKHVKHGQHFFGSRVYGHVGHVQEKRRQRKQYCRNPQCDFANERKMLGIVV